MAGWLAGGGLEPQHAVGLSSAYSSRKYNHLLKLTFDSDVDGLRDEELRLDQHTADVSPLIHPLLNITELQRSVLKHHLSR